MEWIVVIALAALVVALCFVVRETSLHGPDERPTRHSSRRPCNEPVKGRRSARDPLGLTGLYRGTELVTTLKRQATEILSELARDKEPILITQHGVPSPT